jgi:hypothetical protein
VEDVDEVSIASEDGRVYGAPETFFECAPLLFGPPDIVPVDRQSMGYAIPNDAFQ